MCLKKTNKYTSGPFYCPPPFFVVLKQKHPKNSKIWQKKNHPKNDEISQKAPKNDCNPAKTPKKGKETALKAEGALIRAGALKQSNTVFVPVVNSHWQCRECFLRYRDGPT